MDGRLGEIQSDHEAATTRQSRRLKEKLQALLGGGSHSRNIVLLSGTKHSAEDEGGAAHIVSMYPQIICGFIVPGC